VHLLYNLVTRKVVINRDVKFTEEEAWDGSVQTTINVVETEQGAEEDDPIHVPIEQNHEQQVVAVPRRESSSEGQVPSTSTSESSAASLRR